MSKGRAISIISGLGIIITTIIMIFHLGKVAQMHLIHQNKWSLGVVGAVQITATLYGIVICVFSIILILINIFIKSKGK